MINVTNDEIKRQAIIIIINSNNNNNVIKSDLIRKLKQLVTCIVKNN